MKCSWCDVTDEDDFLVEVEVMVASGEEGFAQVRQMFCDRHFPAVQAALIGLGFVDHRHGGINFLEDDRCPGVVRMADCPTPTTYGAVLVGQ